MDTCAGCLSPCGTKSRPHTRPVASQPWLIFPASLLPLIFSSWQTPGKQKELAIWGLGGHPFTKSLLMTVPPLSQMGLRNSACFLCRANGDSHTYESSERVKISLHASRQGSTPKCLCPSGWFPLETQTPVTQEGFLTALSDLKLAPLSCFCTTIIAFSSVCLVTIYFYVSFCH